MEKRSGLKMWTAHKLLLLIISMLAQTLYNVADSYFVSQISIGKSSGIWMYPKQRLCNE